VKNIDRAFYFSLFITFGLFVVTGCWFDTAMWGIDHLGYLPPGIQLALSISLLLGIILLLAFHRSDKIEQLLRGIHDFLYAGFWHKILAVILLMLLFYLSRLETFFLGDGYTLISVMGQGKTYLQRWTVPGSTFLFRIVQGFLGGYTETSAIKAFQILSVVSGGIVVYNFIEIARRLSDNVNVRLAALSTFIFSGATLLFFGYVEFYPVYWASATTFLNLSLRYLQNNRGFLQVILSFAVTVTMHLQAFIMLGGLLVIIYHKLLREENTLSKKLAMSSLITFAILAAVGLYSIKFMPEFFTMKLPMFTGGEELNKFSVYGVDYLLDVINEALLILPGIFILLSLGAFNKPTNARSFFLMLTAVGGVGWIILIDPTLGMGRDWDLLSIPFFLVGLVAVSGVSSKPEIVTPLKVLIYGWCCFVIAASFICVNVLIESSENRFLNLVRRYENKDYTGWTMLAYYYSEKGDEEKLKVVTDEMTGHFPIRGLLKQLNNLFEQNQLDSAISVGAKLISIQPNNHEALVILGNSYKRKGDFESAEKYIRNAIKVFPHPRTMDQLAQLYLHSGQYDKALNAYKKIRAVDPHYLWSLEGLGLTYYNLGHLDSTLAVADSLFMTDKNSAGGHLLKIFVYVTKGELVEARKHYREYVKYGTDRDEYNGIIEEFRQLE
jgi:Tfp pilus assembly protein PilF